MSYEVPRDDRICHHFGARSGSLFTAVWRGILGFNLFIFGAVLLHYDEHTTDTFTYAIMARHKRVAEVLPDTYYWGIGYCVGGAIEILLSISLLFIVVTNMKTRPLLLTWLIMSSIFCIAYTAAVIFQIRQHEVGEKEDPFISLHQTNQTHLEFIFFALPFIGELCHVYFMLVVRCMHRDMKDVPYKIFAVSATNSQQ